MHRRIARRNSNQKISISLNLDLALKQKNSWKSMSFSVLQQSIIDHHISVRQFINTMSLRLR